MDELIRYLTPEEIKIHMEGKEKPMETMAGYYGEYTSYCSKLPAFLNSLSITDQIMPHWYSYYTSKFLPLNTNLRHVRQIMNVDPSEVDEHGQRQVGWRDCPSDSMDSERIDGWHRFAFCTMAN